MIPTSETAPTAAHPPGVYGKGSILADWLSSTDHKIIGHLYLTTSFGFFLASCSLCTAHSPLTSVQYTPGLGGDMLIMGPGAVGTGHDPVRRQLHHHDPVPAGPPA
jgi:heme/copper-type cytochrome/quinol oxidase subunit 1